MSIDTIAPPIVEFTKFLRAFQQVKRDVHIEDGYENDAEHSFQLAMISWWIASEHNLHLNKALLLQYALIHDLVETFAGDTNPLTGTDHELQAKAEKEASAAHEIAERFPTFHELHELIAQYGRKADDESRFIYLVDKILPIINEHISGSSWYRKNKITAQKYKAWLGSRFEKVSYKDVQLRELLNTVVAFLETQGIFAEEPKLLAYDINRRDAEGVKNVNKRRS